MSFSFQSEPFRQQLQESSRLLRLAVRLAWRSSPRLALGMLLLLVVQALLSPLQLVLSRAVIDRAALDLGLLAPAAGLVAQWPLAVWGRPGGSGRCRGAADPALCLDISEHGRRPADRLRHGTVDPGG